MVEKQLRELRENKRLMPVGPEFEGSPLGVLPDNVFGFTYSPLNEHTPLFMKQTFQCFEVHKLAGGQVHLLGFVTPEDAARINSGIAAIEFHLFPAPFQQATELVEVPLERIRNARPFSRQDGNFLPILLDAASA
jgi:hypothetical protein